VDRSAAKTAMAEATAIREKEAGAFAKESSDLKTNIAAIGKAVAALEQGQAGAFLQTEAASVLKTLVENNDKLEMLTAKTSPRSWREVQDMHHKVAKSWESSSR